MIEILAPTLLILLSLLVGLTGLGRRPGFWVAFIGSLVLTPYIMFLVLYLMVWRRDQLKR